MDPQALIGLSARIAHLTELIDADEPGCVHQARVELLDLVVDLLPATRWASFSYRPDPATGPVATVSTSGPVGGRLDELQYEAGEGPVLLALTTGETVTSQDLAGDDRWPGFSGRAVIDTPVRSVCSYPLGRTGHLRSTTLNLYSDRRESFTGEPSALVTLVAVAAGLAVAAIARREQAVRS